MKEGIYTKPLAIVDVETTGGSPVRDRIIEIAVIKIENGKVTKRFSTVIDPEQHIPQSIYALTGISDAEIERAPTFVSIANEIHEMLKDSIFVAHNARFDYAFVKNELKRFGISYTAKCLCTVKLSRRLFSKYRRHDLSTLIDRHGFVCEDRHRAMGDAQVVADFLTLCETDSRYATSVSTILKNQSIPATISRDVINALPEGPGVYIFYGSDGEPLYVGKSINIKNRVMSHFAGDHSSGKEMRLAQETADIETIQTAGELSALLLESHLIKKEQPLYNRLSRHARKMVVLKEVENKNGYLEVEMQSYDSADLVASEKTIGIHKSLSQAKKALQELAKEHVLCPRLLGLEKGKGQCFYSQLGQCNGACGGREDALIYNSRFIKAFNKKRIKSWPFSGPVVIDEKFEGEKDRGIAFVVDNWCLIGSYKYEGEAKQDFLPASYAFDHDSYKILMKSIMAKSPYNIRVLPSSHSLTFDTDMI